MMAAADRRRKQIDNHISKTAKRMQQRFLKRPDGAPTTTDAHSAAPVLARWTSSSTPPEQKADHLQTDQLNPIGGYHSKMWTEDAKANIRFLRGKLNIIIARECMRDPKLAEKDRTIGVWTVTRSEVSIKSELTSLISLARDFVERQILRHSPPSPSAHRHEEITAICVTVGTLLDNAEGAASGVYPRFRPFISWWSGASVEATYKNLHYAEAVIARLYTVDEVRFALPDALRRAITTLAHDNPTRKVAVKLLQSIESTESFEASCSAQELSELIAVGHGAADRSRARLHEFRNVLLIGTVLSTLLLTLLLILVAYKPSLVPLCFTQHPAPTDPLVPSIACPTREGRLSTHPSGGDLAIVAMMGLFGGSISAAVFVRGLYANSTPYNVAIPLALLKLPAGATIAVLGMILLAGDFVPGFNAIDKQVQILAYAILLGFSQQLFTQMLDQRAEKLIANVPSQARREDVPLTEGRRASSS
jgi:hypothetical protein